MALSFRKMVPKKSYQHVVNQIQEAILNGELKHGDRLPPELKLKEMFDTGRGTIREALRVLEQKGLVSVKTGVKGGATIQQAGIQPVSESIGLLIRHRKVSLSDLAQFRMLLEGFVASEAAQKAAGRDKHVLKKILSRAESLVRSEPDGWEEFNLLDAQFHQELAQIAGNLLVQANLKTIHENIHIYFHQYLPFNTQLLQEDYRDLYAIYEAVFQNDPGAARKKAGEHVARFNALMEEQMDRKNGMAAGNCTGK